MLPATIFASFVILRTIRYFSFVLTLHYDRSDDHFALADSQCLRISIYFIDDFHSRHCHSPERFTQPAPAEYDATQCCSRAALISRRAFIFTFHKDE